MAKTRRALFSAAVLLPSVMIASLMACTKRGEPAAHIKSLTIESPGSYWTLGGFAEMTPPVRLPSSDGKESIVVWLRIPDGALLLVTQGPGNRPTLSYPPGTIADRVDLHDGSDPSSVGDVRGTRFLDGGELFHVYRPLHPGGLDGLEWPRGDAVAERQATMQMLDRMARARGLQNYTEDHALVLFERQNACASCHVHDKAERRLPAAENASDDRMPNRATDGGGLYVVATVLSNTAPLETHRARDMNEGDPFVTVTCSDGTAARLTPEAHGRHRHYACEDASVPYARLDLSAARAGGDPHAAAVCKSRAYLAAHMDDGGRAAFAAAFTECGLP